MTTQKPAPLIGHMIIEDYDEDYSHWDGRITFPDPTGSNIAWLNSIEMIEKSYADTLERELADVVCEKNKLSNLLADQIKISNNTKDKTISEQAERIKELEEALEFYMKHADCRREPPPLCECRCSFCKNETKYRKALKGSRSV